MRVDPNEICLARRRRPAVARGALLGAVMVVAGCAARAPVGTDFPRPLVEPLPVRMGVQFPEELKTFQHEEEIPGDRKWIVTLGPANEAMFTRLFEAMFEEMVMIDPPPAQDSPKDAGEKIGGSLAARGPAARGGGTAEASSAPLDAILTPIIESYEFANPLEANDEATTVWITYRMRLTYPDGRLIAEWPVRAYGRSPYGFMEAKDSLVDATEMAMRDAGAYITLNFADEPRVREWLRETGKLEVPR